MGEQAWAAIIGPIQTAYARYGGRIPLDSPEVRLAMSVLDAFPERYQGHWLAGMRAKLGLGGEEPDDLALATDFLATMVGQSVDYTQAFRALAEVVQAEDASGASLRAHYANPAALDAWLPRWHARGRS